MHTTIIDPAIRARYRALKGGREFAYRDIDPTRTAHLVVDMQNAFVEEGAFLEVPEARDIVDNINAVTVGLREAGGINVFFRFTTTATDHWPVFFQHFQNETFAKTQVETFQHGSHGHALYPRLDVREQDLILDKTRFSAFTQGHSDALDILRARGIETLLISGTLTNVCCELTARDAQQLGFKVIMVADANAALSEAEHNSAINTVASWSADIRSAAQTVALLKGEFVD
ncbi:cysteine hydrolase [Marinobacter sp. X15-166B]|uniref:cysteine hydrolase n=1 Tax=Marinobacter sp. X15-166B TaxID=1897620 RepID=UPI00085C40AB|nr:cysteine hydrolase [Marinobacter sp. X15-166B]OEY65935.1 hypothetical protein BG841_05345 [Marinobacter sp. X15-166B]